MARRLNIDNRVECFFKVPLWMPDNAVSNIESAILNKKVDIHLSNKSDSDAVIIVKQDMPVKRREMIKSIVSSHTKGHVVWFVVEHRDGTSYITKI